MGTQRSKRYEESKLNTFTFCLIVASFCEDVIGTRPLNRQLTKNCQELFSQDEWGSSLSFYFHREAT